LKTATPLPPTIASGSNSLVKFDLTGPAPVGLIVSLVSSNPSVLPVPATISGVTGEIGVSVLAKTNSVTGPVDVFLTGTHEGISKTAKVTVVPVALDSLTVSNTAVRSGGVVYIDVRLNGYAPAGGFAVGLSKNNSALSLPATVTVPAGAASVRVTATADVVSGTTTVIVTGSASGVFRNSPTITVNP
jgi:hypothetical protein